MRKGLIAVVCILSVMFCSLLYIIIVLQNWTVGMTKEIDNSSGMTLTRDNTSLESKETASETNYQEMGTMTLETYAADLPTTVEITTSPSDPVIEITEVVEITTDSTALEQNNNTTSHETNTGIIIGDNENVGGGEEE